MIGEYIVGWARFDCRIRFLTGARKGKKGSKIRIFTDKLPWRADIGRCGAETTTSGYQRLSLGCYRAGKRPASPS